MRDSISNDKVNPKTNRYPFSIVWTPIPFLTYLFPFLGHMGIGDSEGLIHDFSGPYTISIDDMAFGKPTKFLQLDIKDPVEYNEKIQSADEKFKREDHSLLSNNCHSHVVYVLNTLNY